MASNLGLGADKLGHYLENQGLVVDKPGHSRSTPEAEEMTSTEQ
jgi:hypothetical protein